MTSNLARDPLKDAEARVRALTREVGALREDLRRETKRRERAVTQSQEAEAARSSAENKLHELTYANRKLAAEVDAAQAAAKAAGERDRRALRTLREGLAEVEGAVAQRAERGSLQVASAFGHVNTLRAMLLSCGPSGLEPVLPHALANSVTHTLADIIRGLSAISALLTNAPDAEEQAAAALSGAGSKDGPGSSNASGGGDGGGGQCQQRQQQQQHSWPSIKEAGATLLAGAKIDLEKEGLRDEVHRLRVQLRTLVEEQSGTANAAALSLQSQLRSYMAAAEATQADLQAQIKQRDVMVDSLRADLQHSVRIKGAEEEKVHAELLAKLHEQATEADALHAKLAALQADLAAAEGICKESAATTEALGTEVRAQAARAEQAEAARSSMHAQLEKQSEEAEALRVEVRELHQALQAMGYEGKALHAELERLQDRVHAAEAAGAGDATVVAELRAGHDAALHQVHGLQHKLTQLQSSEAAVKREWERAQALLAEREAQLAKCQAQLVSQATHLASLQATITAQNEDMTRALSLVTQGHPHPHPSLTMAKRASSSPPPHPFVSHVQPPLQQPSLRCPGSPPGLPQQHQHQHRQNQQQQQEDSLQGAGRGQGGSSPRAPVDRPLLGKLSPGAPRTSAACPPPHGSASPPLNPQQELQQLLQLQQERRQSMLAAHARVPPPPVPDHGWAVPSKPMPGMQAGAAQQLLPRHHSSPTAGGLPLSAALGPHHHHTRNLGGSSHQPAAHAAPLFDRPTQKSPIPLEAQRSPSAPASAAAPIEARALQPLTTPAMMTLPPPAGAALHANSLGSHASSDKENVPAQYTLLPRHPHLHATASTSLLPQHQPSPSLQESRTQQGGTLGVGDPIACSQQQAPDLRGSHKGFCKNKEWGSRHRDGACLGAGPVAAGGAGHVHGSSSNNKNAAAAAGADHTQPPQPDKRLHALVDQLRSSRVASAAQRLHGQSSNNSSNTPGGIGEQQVWGGAHRDGSLGQCADRATSWLSRRQGGMGGSGDSRSGSGGEGGDGGFGSIATASTDESRSPAATTAPLPSSTAAAAAADRAIGAASAHMGCANSVWRGSGAQEHHPTGAFPGLSFNYGRQEAAAQMPPPARHPLHTPQLPPSNITIAGMQSLPGQGLTSPASSCSSSSPSCAVGAQPPPRTAPLASQARPDPTGLLPAGSFSFGDRQGPQQPDRERAQPAFGPSFGIDGAESQQETDLQLHMRTLDSEIEALGASLTAAARNAGVAAT